MAVHAHARIIKSGYEAHPFFIGSLMLAYVHSDQPVYAQKVLYGTICKDFDSVTGSKLICGFMRIGEYGVGKKVFSRISDPDVVTWNSLIGGYVKNTRYEEALKYFKRMLIANVEPDAFTFASVFSGCARLGALTSAVRAHKLMCEKKIEPNSILSAALIDMYSRCGSITTAKEVFDSVQHDEVSVWNAMIMGLAIHGLALDAISTFSQMEMEDVSPDKITFVAILTACSHSGMVEQGRKYFDRMRKHYMIQPELEHYGATVDLLGRAGHLDEAYAMIKSMPVQPDVVIWRALLSACKTYRRPEMGEVAIAKIAQLRSGDYALLSNMYCSLNKWERAARVRAQMRKEGVHKKQGKTWIELAGVIHQFKACDQSHPEMKGIFKVLEGLNGRIKLEGFVHATEVVLMDVSEEEKEGNLNQHSEKLAVAYGILKSSPGTEIRLSKNLRTCYDCHCWMKMVSKVLNRVIVVRDRIRFHHLDGGLCSCRDYW